MRFMSIAACALAATFSVLFAEPLTAQTAEQLTFIPAGGRTLLSNIVASKPSADELKALLTGKHSREEWSAYLRSRSQALPAAQRLKDKEQATLADYLSYHMPLPQVPANLARTDGPALCRRTAAICPSITARAATSSQSSSPKTEPKRPGSGR